MAGRDYKTRNKSFRTIIIINWGSFISVLTISVFPLLFEKNPTLGLAADEFTKWQLASATLYQEARRMISDYVLTENDAIGRGSVEDSIGMGSYRMDSHNCKQVVHASRTINEGDISCPPCLLSQFHIGP